MADEPKRFIAIIQMRADSTLRRLQEDVPEIMKFLDGMSLGEMQQVFRSNDGTLFAFFLRSSTPAFAVHAEFEKCRGTRDGDSLLMFEAGALHTGSAGFSRAWTWLQRH